MNRTLAMAFAASAAAAVVVGCASTQPGPEDAQLRAQALEVMKVSFKEKGQAKLDRLNQDRTQALCSEYAGKELPHDVAVTIEKINLETIRYPADGKYVGDWKSGEKIAQLGQGGQYSDDPKKPSGANCYACHELTKEEISHGTIGPSLYHFGKLRGFTDETRRYAWGKVWNAEAFSACTNMPRFGHSGILTEQQVRDVVALLMDPASPVNR
ncbi:MAG: sulfur oxidation c-type cytochrome SoxX [Burkholderiales bacterium]|nr:sulfur oxidation c-type cytochrome SoxX [Burkholderiales bacterium]MCE7878355.1 sulfur oxidation c-type cytochrome SoxX [Betaproteobacteria bacterium PRO3]